jgi:cell wall-associated NlpC family hydrolase
VHRVRSPLTRLLALAALVSLSRGLAVPVGADEIADKKAEAQRIASQLDAQSSRLADLAEQFNEARLQSEKVSGEAAAAAAEVARLNDQVAENRRAVKAQAVAAYVKGGLSPTANLDSTTAIDPSRLEQYVASIIGQRADALDELQAAKQALAERQTALDAARAKARSAVAKVDASKRDASAAQADQQATLGKVQGELAGLVAAESQRRAAEEARKAQQALAARQARDDAARANPTRTATAPDGSTKTAPRTSPKPKTSPAEPTGPPPGPPASGASAAVAKAKQQIGKPYEWGAAGPDSFDCSGLTMFSWKAGGRSLPHSSRSQWGATTRVAIDDLQPGDIVFYGSPIHHVGLYVGGGQMLEASETGTPVRYASIYRKDLVGAGRVF